MFYLDRSLMTNSAMIKIANTNDGSDVFMSSGLFREYPVNGKREIAAPGHGCMHLLLFVIPPNRAYS